MAEEDKLRYLEAVDKVGETGGIGMIIGEILCLFVYNTYRLLLLPIEFGVSCKSTMWLQVLGWLCTE